MNNCRIGHGYDVHRLVSGRKLIIGGVVIPYDKGLEGHSDADVLLHAISDALLGAACLPDIGQQFPDNDEKYRGADSCDLLRAVKLEVIKAGFKTIINIDATIVAQEPKMNPHIQSMRSRIAEVLEIDENRIGLKATTNEGIGSIGRGEGIASFAVCLISSDV